MKRFFLQTLAGALPVLLLLAGCGSLPRAEAPAVPEPTVPARWQAPLAHDGSLTTLSGWWQSLDDPVLPRLIDAAQQVSGDVVTAASRVRQGRAAVALAGAELAPTVDGSASASRGRPQPGMPVASTLQAGVQASWEIDLFGANQLAQDAARTRLDGTQAAWHDARVAVAAEVAQRYFSERACRHLARIARLDADSRASTRRLTDLSLDAGFTAPGTAQLARAGAAEANARALAQQTLCELDVKALVVLTGWPEADLRRQLAQAPDDLAPAATLVVSTIPAQVLAQRPDLRRARMDVVAAGMDRGVAEARRYPRISLSGSIGAAHYRAAGTGSDAPTWSLGPLALSLPILDGGRIAANVDGAQARFDEAVGLYQARVRQAVGEVEQALVRLQDTAARDTDARAAEAGYRAWLTSTQARYDAGLASLPELEETRRTAYAAADALVRLRRERIGAWIDLYRAAGGGWDPVDNNHTAP